MAARPKRQKRGDRLLDGMAGSDEIQCDYAVAGFDRKAREMDSKWGVDRLPELVSAETARKYGSALAKLNAALNDANPKETASRAEVCIRGMVAMDREATQEGHQPATGDFWEAEVDGFRFGVLRDGVEWQQAYDKRPDLTFYTLREVGLALGAYAKVIPLEAAKKTFPGAEITKIAQKPKTELEKELNDEIPF